MMPQPASTAAGSSGAQHPSSQSGGGMMNTPTRQEFLQAVHVGLQDIPYMVIGGSALAEYGSLRKTADVDVLIGGGYSKGSAEDLLVQRNTGRIRRLGEGAVCYDAMDGRSYRLDLSTDGDVEQPFDVNHDTTMRGGARVATLVFLLNSKAHAWQRRFPFEANYEQKRQNDAQDILFCLQLLRGRGDIDRSQLTWVYSRGFWTPFLAKNPSMGQAFRAAGLWTEETSFSSASSAGARSSVSA